MRGPVVVLIVALLQSSFTEAQVCPPAPPSAGAPAWFEFQVETHAQFIPGGGELPFPDATLNQRTPYPSDYALVQFIVDTSGVPIAKSLKILMRPEGLVADSVGAAVPRWRFQPAMARGCHVPQLVQIALRWK
jgi:hypothetical protein